MFPKDLLSMTEFNQLSLHLAEDHYLARLIKDKGNSFLWQSDEAYKLYHDMIQDIRYIIYSMFHTLNLSQIQFKALKQSYQPIQHFKIHPKLQ